MGKNNILALIIGASTGLAISGIGFGLAQKSAKKSPKKKLPYFLSKAQKQEDVLYYWHIQGKYEDFISSLVHDAEEIMWGNK